MAERSFTVSVSKWGYIRRDNPDTHYSVTNTGIYNVVGTSYNKPTNAAWMLMRIAPGSYPAAAKHCLIIGYEFTLRCRENQYPTSWNDVFGDFNANTVTWNSFMDTVEEYGGKYGADISRFTGGDGTSLVNKSSIERIPDHSTWEFEKISLLLQHGTVAFMSGTYGGADITKNLANGSAPTLKVYYDDSQIMHPYLTVSEYPNGVIDPTKAQKITWEHTSYGNNCPDPTWNQTSAKIYWRVSDASTWNSVSLTSQKTYTFTANSFPSASTIQWYLETVDEDGTTTTFGTASNPKTFTTPTSTVTMTANPSGTNVDTRLAHEFTWKLNTGATVLPDYPQQSATLYWKLSTETDSQWRSVTPTAGSVKTILMPVNTFPTAATIQWYIEATDTGGHTSRTTTASFRTVSTTITPVTYPEGSNVSPAQNIPFTWRYNCAFNDYDQQSAIFHWRVSTATAWNNISISGNVKEVEIPAYTFPTAVTIQWYVEGTDVGGTHTQTTTRTFNTVRTQITPQDSPSSGYTDPRYPITISWYLANAANDDFDQSSAALHWRISGSETWTDITFTGNTKTVTFPANTFPVAATIEWYLEGTDRGGYTSQTQIFSFSTAASTAYAVCIAPVGRVEDGTKAITFTWSLQNDDGTEPTRIMLQWKYDVEAAAEWKTILDTAVYTTEYTVPEEFFSAGNVEWKISAWNRDNVQGPENLASFICMLAPDAPVGVRATAVPRTTVSWQSSGQEAYEITIDGRVEVKEYGPGVYKWQREEPLEDGEHVITVRVQGVYGLWSNLATTTIFVVNAPATTISLSGEFSADALLTWEYGSAVSNPEPNVYRDGVRIAALKDVLTYTDRFVLGEHDYFVTIWHDDGNYTKSNVVRGTMECVEALIGATDGGEWVALKLTDNSDSTENFQWSRVFAMHSIRGARYPILELGEREDLSGTYICAFSDMAEAKKLEALQGKQVVLKSRRENVMIGVMTSLQKTVRHFFNSYSFTLQQIFWEDLYHDPNR